MRSRKLVGTVVLLISLFYLQLPSAVCLRRFDFENKTFFKVGFSNSFFIYLELHKI